MMPTIPMTPEAWGALGLVVAAAIGFVLCALALADASHTDQVVMSANTRVLALKPVFAQGQQHLAALMDAKLAASRGSIAVGGAPPGSACDKYCNSKSALGTVLKSDVLDTWRGATSKQALPTADGNAFCVCVEDPSAPFGSMKGVN